MDLLYISIFAGVFSLLLLSIIEDLILGDRGKNNQISEHFKYLKGGDAKEQRKIKVTLRTKNNIFERYKKKYIAYTVIIYFTIFLIIFIAFKSIYMAFIISPLALLYSRQMKKKDAQRRKSVMNLQFVDALNSITNSMKAGLSINSALIKCCEELERIYEHLIEKPMLEEFTKIKNDLNMGMPVEEVLKDFSERLKMEDVEDFVNSIIIVRQKGGNLVEVMVNITKIINDKISIKKEIDVLTAGKKMEAKIVSIVPVLIVILLSIFSPNYMRPLYATALGRIIIVFGFMLLVLNYYISKKIVNIRV